MILLTFKNVGQGDSIIIEWEDGNNKKIAIIDCNVAHGGNPVLEHIKNNGYHQIDLLILSHPHSDHFSGYSELLQYCIDSNIQIKYFLHTANNNLSYWHKAVVTGVAAYNELTTLFKMLRKAECSNGMRIAAISADLPNYEINLTGTGVKLKLLAPTHKQLDYYAINQPVESNDNEENGNNQRANWLSTVIKLYKDDWFVLLCSDVEKGVLLNLGLKHKRELTGKLILGQSPHHGSYKNHKNSFWKGLTKSDKPAIVFSVGRNSYDHPSDETIKKFIENGFEIFSTNGIGKLSGLSDMSTPKENLKQLSSFGISIPPLIKNKFNGDQVFQINSAGEIKYVP